jgi:predicted nucleic acid binding AN1-type Zn finger protein
MRQKAPFFCQRDGGQNCEQHLRPGGHMFRGRAEKAAKQYLRAFMRNGIPGSTGRKQP